MRFEISFFHRVASLTRSNYLTQRENREIEGGHLIVGDW